MGAHMHLKGGKNIETNIGIIPVIANDRNNYTNKSLAYKK